MDIFEILVKYSPFLMASMCLYISFGLWKINKARNMWELKTLLFVPTTLFLMYMWIGIFQSSVYNSRNWSRMIIGFNLGVVIPIINSSLKLIKNKNKGGK